MSLASSPRSMTGSAPSQRLAAAIPPRQSGARPAAGGPIPRRPPEARPAVRPPRTAAGRPSQGCAPAPGRAGAVPTTRLPVAHPLGAVAVAHPRGDPRQRPGPGAESGDPLMVLEPGEPRHTELGIDVGDDLANTAPLAAAARDVQDAQPGHRLALGTARTRVLGLVVEAHTASSTAPPHAAAAAGRRRAAAAPRGLRRGPRRRPSGRCPRCGAPADPRSPPGPRCRCRLAWCGSSSTSRLPRSPSTC